MSDSDKTEQKLVESMRKTKAGATAKTATAAKKTAATKKTAARKPATGTDKARGAQTGRKGGSRSAEKAPDPYQRARRVWPD